MESAEKEHMISSVLWKPPPFPNTPCQVSRPFLTPSPKERRAASFARAWPPTRSLRDRLLSSWVVGKEETSSAQEQAMEDCTDRNLAQRSTIPTGFFGVPGLFVRLSNKGLNEVDPDSVCSPTSLLDFKNLPSNNTVRTNLKPPRLQGIEADLKLRMSPPRVGLGLVNALTAHESKLHSGFKNPFLALGLPRVATDASPQNNGSIGITMNGIIDFALSEEYTCVIQHGPNPKTTHILGGQTLEVHKGVRDGSKRPIFTIKPTGEQSWPPSLAGVASGLCSCCRKRLRKNRDIYMGEKAFCSNECRKGCIEVETEEAKLTYAGCWQLLCSFLVKLVVVARKYAHKCILLFCLA